MPNPLEQSNPSGEYSQTEVREELLRDKSYKYVCAVQRFLQNKANQATKHLCGHKPTLSAC